MKSPFDTTAVKSFVEQLGDAGIKLVKGSETLTEIDQIDVGTAPKDLVYAEDKLELFHYRPEGKVTCNVPVLIVYALVNRQYMLDLQPDRSVVRNLLQHGIDVYIIDWGYPTKADMYLSLDDYINGYLNNCVDVVRKHSGADRINLMGICQGGTFSGIFSALYPEKVRNLITIAAPFDFSTNDALLFNWSKDMPADDLVDTYRVVPGDVLNAGFLMLMPFTLNIRKYVDMLDLIEDKEKILNFLRMEKWIFDSPGQAGECLRQFIKDCYQENKLVKGELNVGDKTVNLKNITMPLLNIYATADHLVPPSATKPLNDLVGSADKSLYEFKGGHIGIFVGTKSQKELAPSIAQWLQDRCGNGAKKPEKPEAPARAPRAKEAGQKRTTRKDEAAKA